MLYSIYIRKNVRPFRLSTAYRRSNPTIKVILRNIRKTTFVTVKFMVRYYYTVVTIRSSKSLGQATIKNRFAMAEWLPQSLSFLYVRQTAGMDFLECSAFIFLRIADSPVDRSISAHREEKLYEET